MTIDEAINRIETVKCFLKECSYENIKNTKFPEFMPLIKDEYEKNKYSLDSVITFLRAQAERDNPQPQWISVSDKLPNKEGMYLCYFTNTRTNEQYIDMLFFTEECHFEATRCYEKLTHWMHLPVPPKGA